MTGWWQQFEADIQAVERAIARQHQAVLDAGDPWPPQPDAAAAPLLNPEASPEDQPAHNDTAARLDELLAQADQATQRIAAEQAERQASSGYTARIEREAQAEPEAEHHAEARDQAEMEL